MRVDVEKATSCTRSDGLVLHLSQRPKRPGDRRIVIEPWQRYNLGKERLHAIACTGMGKPASLHVPPACVRRLASPFASLNQKHPVVTYPPP